MADAGRVIAGSARSIRLATPGGVTRPLGDRVKQTMFAILEPDLPGARFLDLFAGSGAAGIEALSRGAAEAVFVERDAGAARTIEANLRATRLAGERAGVARREVGAYLADPRVPGSPATIAFVDPPYAEPELLLAALRALGDPLGRVLSPGARVVAKHSSRTSLPARIGLLASERNRRFGETALAFYRRTDPDRPPEPDSSEEDA
ncbi:MAG TPA: 16S rRNA (guanine(966)-N(2))-methyltransferase RsmD [Candidatus Limnocylindrales bacterium]|nr:16S rRNA (guanine(966)-N(2))-methyltransferase RsmD [Candidatus Limnocylindrales bacterium]